MPEIKTILIKDSNGNKAFRVGRDKDGSYFAERRGDLMDCEVKIMLDSGERITIPAGRRKGY